MQIMSPAATPVQGGRLDPTWPREQRRPGAPGRRCSRGHVGSNRPPCTGGGRGGHNLHVLLPACVMTDSVLTDLPESAGFCQFLTIPDGPTALRSHALTVPRSSLH